MELNQLKYFLDVAQTQHITNSAERLHISQPSLTLAVKRLEEELGVPLFVKKGRNIILSEYGKYFKEKLEPIMAELERLPVKLKKKAELENSTIHLNVLAASTLVTAAIIEYKKKHHDLNFQVMQHSENNLYDIGITTKLFYRCPEDREENTYVFSENIYLAVPAAHPLAQKDSINLEEAADEDFISLMGSRQLRWICDRFCRHAGFTPKIIFESDNPASVKNMIGANIGVGFWPEFTWGHLSSDRVKLLKINEPACRRDILFDCRTNKTDTSSVRDFFEFLKEFCESVRQTGGEI